MRSRPWLYLLLTLVLSMIPRSPYASKQALLFLGVDLHGRSSGQRIKAGLSEQLGKRLVSHLDLLGVRTLVPSAREVPRPCTRECQILLAQRRQADILRAEITQDGDAYDIWLWLWRFDPRTGRPLTDYAQDRQVACEGCSEQQLALTLCEGASFLLERASSVQPTEPRPAAATQRPLPIASSAGPGAAQPQPLSTGRKVAGGIFAGLAGFALGGAISLTWVNSEVSGAVYPKNPSLGLDFKPVFAIAYGVSGALGLTSILIFGLPESPDTLTPIERSPR